MKKLLLTAAMIMSASFASAENIVCSSGSLLGKTTSIGFYDHYDANNKFEFFDKFMNNELTEKYRPASYIEHNFDFSNGTVLITIFSEDKDEQYDISLHKIQKVHKSEGKIIIYYDGGSGRIYINPKRLADLKQRISELSNAEIVNMSEYDKEKIQHISSIDGYLIRSHSNYHMMLDCKIKT